MQLEKAVKKVKLKNRRILTIGATFLLGVTSFVVFRFVTFVSPDVHYHANFALYINGQRDELKSFTFYEELQSCVVHDSNNPKTRVHMHDQNNGLIHVHSEGVTWGHYFANLGYTVGDKLIETDNVYIDGNDGNRLIFVLNGKKVNNIANLVIRSEDRLLIDYGTTSPTLLDQYFDTVPADAHKSNTESDPASCSGGSQTTVLNRLKKSIYQ